MKHDFVRKYFRAGLQRLNAAEVLYHEGVVLDALYLGGYCVECTMKAMILKHVPTSQHERFLSSFRGDRAHDIEFLKHLWKQSRCEPLPMNHVAPLREFASIWSPNLRYEVGPGNMEDAAVSLRFARQLANWIHERIR